MPQPLVLYPHSATATQSANAGTLSATPPTPSNNFPSANGFSSLLGTAVNWGEITAKGTASAWAAAGSIQLPTGKGFFFDVTTLDGMMLPAGAFYAEVRLSTAVANNPTAETVVADLFMRWYLWRSGVYNSILGLSGLNITIGAFADFSLLYGATTQDTFFHAGDKLYMDLWANIHTNGNADAGLQLRWNSIATTAASSVDNYFALPGYLPYDLAAIQSPVFPPVAATFKEN